MSMSPACTKRCLSTPPGNSCLRNDKTLSVAEEVIAGDEMLWAQRTNNVLSVDACQASSTCSGGHRNDPEGQSWLFLGLHPSSCQGSLRDQEFGSLPSFRFMTQVGSQAYQSPVNLAQESEGRQCNNGPQPCVWLGGATRELDDAADLIR